MRNLVLFVVAAVLISIIGFAALAKPPARPPDIQGFRVLRAAAPIRTYPAEAVRVVQGPDGSGFGVYQVGWSRFIGKPSEDGGTVAVWRWVRQYARPSGSTQYVKATSDS